ncbi:hypothetical protein V8E36_000951 [Tilletia maclaganii]
MAEPSSSSRSAPSSTNKPRHASFARELFRFNNSSPSSPFASSSSVTAAGIQRIGSADGGPTAYGVVRHRAGTGGPIPMRKSKTQGSYPSSNSGPTHSKDSGGDEKNHSKRASRLSALLSPHLWSSAKFGPSSRARVEDHAQLAAATASVAPSHAATPLLSPALPSSPLLGQAQLLSSSHEISTPQYLAVNGSELVELPVGARVGKTARNQLKQHLHRGRPHTANAAVGHTSHNRHASMPSTLTAAPAAVPTAPPAVSPQYPLPLPPGQKARTVLVGISPPPTAALDGSLAAFEHVRRWVLREGEEAILHTVLPESQARRKVTSPQDLIELTTELEREDARFLEMQSACMNFLTLLAVELETSQRFVKIHVTQAQPPDGGSAAQARASDSRSHSRAGRRAGGSSRPSSSAGLMGRTASLGGLFGFGGGSAGGGGGDGEDDSERGRTRTCERLKAREDEAIALELGRVAREYKADLIAVGHPSSSPFHSSAQAGGGGGGSTHDEAGGKRSSSRPQSHSRSRMRPHSRADSRSRLKLDDVALLLSSSRRDSRASKGSAGSLLGRRGSAAAEDMPSSILVNSDGMTGLSAGRAGLGHASGPPDFSRSASEYTSRTNSSLPADEADAMASPPSGLSADWNFGADSLNAVLPATASLRNSQQLDPGTDSPRTAAAQLAAEHGEHGESAARPASVSYLVDDAHRVGQSLLVSTGRRRSSHALAEAAAAAAAAESQHQSESGHSAPAPGLVSRRGSRVIILDEPPDSPLRQRDRERAAAAASNDSGSGAVPGSPLVASISRAGSVASSGRASSCRRGSIVATMAMTAADSNYGGGAAPAELGPTDPVAPTNAPEQTVTRLRSTSGSAVASAGGSKRLSKFLGRAPQLFSGAGHHLHGGRDQRELNGLATELVRKAPVPVLVVDEDLIQRFR